MGDGGKQQKEQKQQSIRAARDWLTEADASLTSGSGLKGDLKVMLAQAELQRAQEAEPSGRFQRARRWAWRIVPLTTAAIVVALAWFLTPAVAPPETAIIPSRPAEITAPGQSGEHTTETVMQEAAAVTETSALANGDNATQATVAGTENNTAASDEKRADVAATMTEEMSPAVPQAAAAQPSTPAVPAPETQKLMQSAGKALRQP